MTNTEPDRFVVTVPIRELRIARGLSVNDLVERIHETTGLRVHGDTIRNVELGHKRGSAKLMTAWATALRINALDVYQVPTAIVSEQMAA